jgi:hypothetical protein
VRRFATAFGRVVADGRFLSPWSLAATLVLSMTIMAPVGAGVDVAALAPATLATTTCFVLALGALALIERQVSAPRVRAIVLIVGIVACAALRPLVQDAWAALWALPIPAAAQLPFRIATNVVVWPVVLAMIAVLENAVHTLRRTNALLREVAAELAAAPDRAVVVDRRARREVDAAASALSRAIDRWDPATGPSGVRALGSEAFRTWSHRLQQVADDAATTSAPRVAPATDGISIRRRGLALPPLRLPPRGTVAIVYIACTLPYALRTTGPAELIAGLVAVVAVTGLVDHVARRRRFVRSARLSATVYLLGAAIGGVVLSVLAAIYGHRGLLALLPAIDYLAFALAAGLCAGAVQRLRREQRRLSGTITHSQRASREGVGPAREGLRRTAELLHRDGQGACMQFALTHPHPSPADTSALRDDLLALVHRLTSTYAAADPGTDAAALRALLATWGRVIVLQTTLDPRALAALDAHPRLARDVYDVIAEGLLNAVKHSDEKSAEVSLDVVATGAGSRLRARVRSRGRTAPDAELRPASHARDLGARLRTDGRDTLLEALFALPPTTPVVSAEHPEKQAAPSS